MIDRELRNFGSAEQKTDGVRTVITPWVRVQKTGQVQRERRKKKTKRARFTKAFGHVDK